MIQRRATLFTGFVSLFVGLAVAGQCAHATAGSWSFRLPWPASRAEVVYPADVTPWPIPGYLPNYEVGYFRGAELLHRDPRTLADGAWSRNYVGHEKKRHSWLHWWRGQGSYISDGPRPWPFR